MERQIKPRFEFDVRVLNIASVEFQFEVIKTGCVIFSRDKSKRVDFEFKVISAYLDMRYMYDILDRKFLEDLN